MKDVPLATSEWFDPHRPAEELRLFDGLKLLSTGLTTEGRVTGTRLGMREFEVLADNLAIVRPARRFGEFRFEFYGSAFSEASPGGDLTGLSFSDLVGSAYYRSCLSGFWHVHRAGLAHITRDHPIVGGRSRYFTRLIIPVFAGNRTALLLCAAHLHDRPTMALPAEDEREAPLAASA
jgi:hypothetical protein